MQPLEEEKPRETVEEKPQLEQPKEEEQPTVQIAELKFTKPLQTALTPNDERIVE